MKGEQVNHEVQNAVVATKRGLQNKKGAQQNVRMPASQDSYYSCIRHIPLDREPL